MHDEILSALERARALITPRVSWWGKGQPQTPVAKCAIQAVCVVCDADRHAGRQHLYYDVRKRLDLESSVLYRYLSVLAVNDYLGHEAVLAVYDAAIARRKQELAQYTSFHSTEADLAVAGD